jgi:hypothetical protein
LYLLPSRLSRVLPNSFGGSSTGATVGLEGLLEGLEGLAGVVGVVGFGGVVAGGAGFRGLKRSGILNFITVYSLADGGTTNFQELSARGVPTQGSVGARGNCRA